MYNQDIQDALAQLDKGTTKKSFKRYIFGISVSAVVLATVAIGSWAYKSNMPEMTDDHLSRLIIIASRTSNNDPIRMLGDIERHLGKTIPEFSTSDRADAISFLMKHIELHHNRQELISY